MDFDQNMKAFKLLLLFCVSIAECLDIFEYGTRYKSSKSPMKFIKPEDGLVEVCEGDNFVLHCPGGKISFPDHSNIQFGRNGMWEEKTECGPHQNVDHCTTINAKEELLGSCEGLEFCGINLHGWFQGKDPCPALPKNARPRKYLTVQFSCGASDMTKITTSEPSSTTSMMTSASTSDYSSTSSVDMKIQELENDLYDKLDSLETLDEKNVSDYVNAFFDQAINNIQSEDSGSGSPTSILNVTEKISKKLLDLLNNQDDIRSLEFETSQLTIKLTKKTFDKEQPSQTKWESRNKQINLPDQEELLAGKYVDDGNLEIIMAAYENLQEKMKSASDVITVSVNEHVNLSKPVTFLLPNHGDRNVSCAFWSFSEDDWLKDGCITLCHNDTHTKCSCDHLTNFALIFNVHSEFIGEEAYHATKLQYITYVGFTISIVSMVLTIILFMFMSGKTTDRDVIHINLCFSLLTAEIIFMFGIDKTSNTGLCSLISLLLHYFFLSSFAWMFLEGYQIYELLVKVFESKRTGRKRHYVIGYGVPLIIVLAALLVDFTTIFQENDEEDMCFDPLEMSSYGTKTYCWLNAENNFILSFIIPAVIVILSNVAMLIFAVHSMAVHKFGANKTKTQNQEILVSYMKGVLVLMCLLGSTWIFGLLLLAFNSVIIAYTFTTLNSLQGVGIFVFQYLLNPQTKVILRRMFLRLKNNFCQKDRRGNYQRTSCTTVEKSEFSMSSIHNAEQTDESVRKNSQN